MAKAKKTAPSTVANNITAMREAAGLTQRALGALVGTSAEQMARHEAGKQIRPGMAVAIARALEAPLEAVFPSIEARPPRSQEDWQGLGFDLHAPLPSWFLNIQLRGFSEPFIYLVDCQDCERLGGVLDGDCPYDFITFESCGRSIYVDARAIQRIFVVEDGISLRPGVRHTIGALKPAYAALNLYLRDRTEPLCVAALELDIEDLEAEFMPLDGAMDFANRFLAFRDNVGDLAYVRVGEIALVEVPTPELIEELRAHDDEAFWAASYRKLEFEGRALPAVEAETLLPAIAQAASLALQRHVAGKETARPSSAVLQRALADAVEVLRKHGYSVVRGAATTPMKLDCDGYFSPLNEELNSAFSKALNRAQQHGDEIGALTWEMAQTALFTGLAALRDEGYRIVPGDRYVDYEPERGWGGSA